MNGSHLIFVALVAGVLSTKANHIEDVEVLIIGAGAAGIAAATKLLENNVTNLKILEAENRIGGRIFSVKFGDAFVDLGAEWCQEDETDIVYNLAKSYNILKPAPTKRNMIHSDGMCIDPRISQELQDFFYILKSKNKSVAEQELSFGELFLKDYNISVLEKFKSDAEKYQICLEAITTFENLANGRQGSFTWFDLASSSDYEESKGRALDWNGFGFKTILDIMMKAYPNANNKLDIDDKIMLNTIVSKIFWKHQSNKMIIHCEDSSRYRANYVIFTPSAGIMKMKHSEIFEPSLPIGKQNALRKIGFGSLIKVMLHFSEKWWVEDFNGASFVWSENDLKHLATEFPYGPNRDNQSWLSGAYSITSAENNPNVLIVWFSGQFIPEVEELADDIVIDGSMFVIEKFYGETFIVKKPDKMIRSSWYKNPNYLGVYAYESVESRTLPYNSNEELAEPLINNQNVPTLLFAGEATSRKHYGLVRGAIESGYREAERILKLRKLM